MKKKLIYAAVVSALLAGCGGDDNKGDTTSSLDYILSGANGVRPSVLAPRASDGTLKFSTETADLSNPVSALSTLDGWSTTQPVQLVPATVTGVSVPAPAASEYVSAIAPLYLLELVLDPVTLQPNGVKGGKPLVYGTDFVVTGGDGKLNLVPLKPLNPSSYYMIVATDALKDSRGTPLKAGGDYSSFKSTAGATTQEQTINGLISLQEGLFKAATGITSDRVIFSDWFATQSGADVLLAVKSAAASVLKSPSLDAAALWKQDARGNTSLPATYTINGLNGGVDFLTQLANEPFLPQDQKDALTAAFGVGTPLNGVAQLTKVYTGTVKLPYFLSTPAIAGSWDKAKTQSWHGAIPSLYAIANALKAGDTEVIGGLVGAGVDPALLGELIADPSRQSELLTETSKLIGVTLTSGGKPLDAERNIGRFNPLPTLTEVQSVPLRIFAAAPLNTITDVIIYQHGVTSIKENAYALALGQIGAGATASKSVAVVVIDHPLHGERGYALSGSMDTVTTSENPTPYLNLGYLTVARDNLKQSVADLLGLRLAVGLANTQGLGGQLGGAGLKVHFLGHSLGAITGANLLAVANQTTGSALADALFKFDTGGLAMPGGGIAPLLLNSPSFGPTIKMSVLTSGSPALKAGFTAYAPNCKTAAATCFVNEFLPSLDAATQAGAASTLQSYTFAAQSVLDSADPINLASGVAKSFPLFATEIVGDGALNLLPDQVIPNSITSAPLGGTEPLFRVLGLQELKGSGVLPAGHHAARFLKGGHSSLLAPDENFDQAGAVTTEIQTQFASFFMSGGAAVKVTDDTMIKQ
ncbi:VolA/Pla-1 family phospholipase [Aeromonas veronii]|uniref:VolA/Pla-1 family phospholipase n=1 Tax=Aeromonas veronii TaxID=654 RepID=UPI00226D1DB1|nr:VolA/Pla-1 family phospholipase [Aeromonas veronii]MCX9106805.1 lipase [Aeromonas veronii]MCX9122622.1 lipase [Aeromonas veronii]